MATETQKINEILSWDGSNAKILTDNERQLARALSEAYHKKNGSYPFLIEPGGIENSPVKPYQRITVRVMETSLMGYSSLFYRTSSDAEWRLFQSSNVGLFCKDANTQELKNAFSGMNCMSSGDGTKIEKVK